MLCPLNPARRVIRYPLHSLVNVFFFVLVIVDVAISNGPLVIVPVVPKPRKSIMCLPGKSTCVRGAPIHWRYGRELNASTPMDSIIII